MADALPSSLKANPRLSQWLRFAKNDKQRWVEIYSGKVEIGQGILTALSAIAAESLGLTCEQVRAVPATTTSSPNEAVTSGSLSIQDSGSAMRHVCLQARQILLEQILLQYPIPLPGQSPPELQVAEGVIFDATGRKVTDYWSLDANLHLQVDALPLAEASLRFRQATATIRSASPLARLRRIDLAAKFLGKASFIQDQHWPQMLYGLMLRQRVLYLVAQTATDSANLQLVKLTSGIEKAIQKKGIPARLVRDGLFCGYLCENALDLARLDRAVADQRASAQGEIKTSAVHRRLADIPAWLKSTSAEKSVVQSMGDAPTGSHRTRFKAQVFKPWHSHASIGLSCAIAKWTPQVRLEIWTHSQGIYNLRQDLWTALGAQLGFALHQFEVFHIEGAGCYGHNGADDVAFDAARLSLEAPRRPVRVEWTREQELACAPFSPAMLVEATATLSEASEQHASRITSWEQNLWSNGHSLRPGRAETPTLLGASELTQAAPRLISVNASKAMGYGAQRNAVPGYNFETLFVQDHRLLDMPVRSSAFRALGAIANVLTIESLMDEVANGLKEDRLSFRLRHLAGEGSDLLRARAVLNRAAEMAGWSSIQGSASQPSSALTQEPDLGYGIAPMRAIKTRALGVP